jgi:2-dehydro-3-deoxy-D-arabinonate dehydratase
MKLCRFQTSNGEIKIGLASDDSMLLDLTPVGIDRMAPLLESNDLAEQLAQLSSKSLPRVNGSEIKLLAPVERQEVWAAGVTYLRSKTARMEESDFSATAYDRVYSAERPELFFKALAEKVVPSGEPVGIRRDAKWSVPEPELALVLNSRGCVVGYTIGNDMSSRDIEGENLLYLPQAKVYDRSCALCPWITVAVGEDEARKWNISIEIARAGAAAFTGETSAGRIKRTFTELAEFLFRSQKFPHGAVLLTGTGIVPPDDFTLQAGDVVTIHIDNIGTLQNPVAVA